LTSNIATSSARIGHCAAARGCKWLSAEPVREGIVSFAGSAEKETTNEDLESHSRGRRPHRDWIRKCNGSEHKHKPGRDAESVGHNARFTVDDGAIQCGFEFR
jgi:hypothetical protein